MPKSMKTVSMGMSLRLLESFGFVGRNYGYLPSYTFTIRSFLRGGRKEGPVKCGMKTFKP